MPPHSNMHTIPMQFIRVTQSLTPKADPQGQIIEVVNGDPLAFASQQESFKHSNFQVDTCRCLKHLNFATKSCVVAVFGEDVHDHSVAHSL